MLRCPVLEIGRNSVSPSISAEEESPPRIRIGRSRGATLLLGMDNPAVPPNLGVTMAQSTETPLDDLLLSEHEDWQDGPPHETFKRLRSECPVHFTKGIDRVPGRGRLLVGDEGRRCSHRQQGLADVLVGQRDHRAAALDPAARAGPGDVHRHGPAEARSSQGALPAWLHSEANRRARARDSRDHPRGARAARGERDLRPRQRRRPAGRQPGDRQLHGHPARGRRRSGRGS